MPESFSCVLIGHESVLISCGELLLKRGHQVLGMLSAGETIGRWASAHGVRLVHPTGDLKATLSEQPFDYLFSVANRKILPADILHIPRKLAINCHNALLPGYAGVHASAWALLRQEPLHGVTWHVLSEEIDAGDILRQAVVEVDPGETTFTLDGKCYAAALASFGELVVDLEQAAIALRKQDLRQRTYFPAGARPSPGCVLGWNESAEVLSAFVRALDFGITPNALGIPKLVAGPDYLVATALDVTAHNSDAAPGTLLDITSDGLRVATRTQDVVLRQLFTLDGKALTMPALVDCYSPSIGDILPALDVESAARLGALEQQLLPHEAFWVRRLADLRAPELPYASRAAVARQTRRDSLAWQTPREFTDFLHARADPGCTPRTLMLATFGAFLSRIGQTDSFDLGFCDADVSERFQRESTLFARSVPLRMEVQPGQSLEDVLRSVSHQVANAQRHLTYARDVVLRYPQLRSTAQSMARLPVAVDYTHSLAPDPSVADSELTLVIADDAHMCWWVFDADAWDAELVRRMQSQFATFAKRMLGNSDVSITALPLLSDEELDVVQVQWNATDSEYPRNTCLHHMFESQVERTPTNVAVTFEQQQLTYEELNRRANQVANHLRMLGVGPEVVVGVYIDRSIEMIVGLLGILKAGGAYLPLDTRAPFERLRFMLEDADPRVVLTRQALASEIPAHAAHVVCLDTDWAAIADHGDDNLQPVASAANLCYMIYTSGSSGTPKGVLVEHASVCNLAAGLIRAFDVTPDSRCLQFSSFSFDTSVAEIVMALCSGARLCLAPWRELLPGPELLQLLEGQAITHVALPPSTVAVLPPARLPDLRVLIVAGEACPAELVDAWAPGRRFFNGYGPTETTVCASLAECQPHTGKPPIGHAFANSQAYILDRNLHSVPIGVVGELHVGGINVARGYHRRPELTAERFIPDPFSQAPHARLYKTGDLARFRADGAIDYIGRSDAQVKLRGFRVELEEIESVLKQHPDVHQAAVAVHELSPGYQTLVGYVVPSGAQPPATSELRRFALERLPEYMVPAQFMLLQALPQTTSGKLDRRALPAPSERAPDADSAALPAGASLSQSSVERFLVSLWSSMLGRELVSTSDNFFDQGGNSFLSLRTAERIAEEFGIQVPVVALYQYPTIRTLAEHLTRTHDIAIAPRASEDRAREPVADDASQGRPNDVAIIGTAGRFPGASSVSELWQKLCDGEECISHFADDELSPLVDPALRADPHLVRAKGIVEGAEMFDAAFFGMTPKEAEIMDPQHRLFLELAHTALENAGHAPEHFEGAIGVYGGSGFMSYFFNNLAHCPEASGQLGDLVKVLSNDKDYMPSRVAYKLNLRGPSVALGSACSTSLVAVINAVTSLVNRQCDMAIAGGVTIDTPLKNGYVYEEGGMHSPDGHCRPFDARAQGTVMSNGGAVVVLRRLADALRDGDHITAVIRGVGINNDGSQRVSFSAPGVAGQAAAIAMAHANADVDPRTITYIETHGTATPLGDPIEVEALTQAFRTRTQATGFCAIGSVKANIGHLDTAAGVTGLIKVAAALKHRQLPPSLHFETPNPQIDFARSPFYVNTALRDWDVDGGPRRAGVSSFGMGGTNAHVVCEEAPEAEPSGAWKGPHLVALSAKTPTALDAATRQLADHLQRHTDLNLADVCFTQALGRSALPHRRIVVCSDLDDAASALRELPPQRSATRRMRSHMAEIAFLFPGQGAQYINMGQALYQQQPTFKTEVDLCAELALSDLGCDLREVLFASDTETATQLHHTRYTQPAIFTIAHALARLWQSWGIEPRAMLGHSIGEFVAACLAGVFSLEDAVRLVVRRGQMMADLPSGSMLSVRLSAADMERRIGDGLSIAAINGPSLCVVSGPTERVEQLQHELQSEEVPCRLLQTSHAFHSAMVEPSVAPFTELCRRVKLSPPRIDIVSTVTGEWLTAQQATDPEYWGRHMRVPVRFAQAIQTLWSDPSRVLLEVGPGSSGTILARQQISDINTQTAIASLGASAAGDAESTALSFAVGQVWLTGAPLNWTSFFGSARRQRLELPTYPFERKRYWLEPGTATVTSTWTTSVPEPQLNGDAALLRSEPNGAAPPAMPTSEAMVVLRQMLEETTGLDLAPVATTTSWLELGLDSLTLTQFAQRLQKQLQCRVSFRQLVDVYPNLDTLAVLLAQECPPGTFAGRAAVAPRAPELPSSDALPRASGAPAEPARPFVGPGARIDRSLSQHLTPSQQAFVDELIAQYTRRTARSKAYVQANRLQLADPRTVSGFDLLVKEMVYPIVAVRSAGARMWDVDGNEYLDVLSGFGSSLFGYLPPFIKEAIQAQLELGMEIGPQTPLAGEVADLVCQLTRLERAAFCNTGSEAVLGAMRLARTVTGRTKIALFSGSYHGIFDEVLVRGTRQLRPIPAAPGVPQEAVDNLLVLDFDSPESLQVLAAHMHELAAVLVEPVQSRRPDLQPRNFLHLLRRQTERAGVALIVDEMITGFRIDQGGAQAHFGIRADLATYGKIIGGGLPIGVLAGSARFMDAIDGGYWQYGDDSAPDVDITYFAGTFVRHPLAMATARAVLQHLKAAGPQLQLDLNRKSDQFVAQLNAFFDECGAPLHLVNFGSLLKLDFQGTVPFANLLYYALRNKGVHIGEQRPFFFTTAHTDADLDELTLAFRDSVQELQRAGFLQPPDTGAAPPQSNGAALDLAPVPEARLGRDPSGEPGWYVPDSERPGKYVKIETLSTSRPLGSL